MTPMVDKTKINITFTPTYFNSYLPPNGYLNEDNACHALFYYYLIAYKTLIETEIDPIIYEDELWPETNFKQQFTSTAIAYGVAPERMVYFWRNVDMQCDVLGMPRMPATNRLRFDKVAEIKTQ